MTFMTKTKRVLGITGVARAGKDTFATILIAKLEAQGYSVKRIALADALKGDCDEFCKKRLNISAFTQDPKEKLLIRPLLVWYGDAQRQRTNGRYWIDIAQSKIDSSDFDYYVITDVRYSFFEKDEVQWVKDECQGVLCHVSKWGMYNVPVNDTSYKTEWSCVPPANDHEALNDPKMRAAADYRVEWRDVGPLSPEELKTNRALNEYVDSFMQFQEDHFHLHSNQESLVEKDPVP
jgi:hypothetical protein